MKINEVKIRCDAVLSATDWTRLDDNGLNNITKENWRLFRVKVRTLRQTVDDLPQDEKGNIIYEWPVAPSEGL